MKCLKVNTSVTQNTLQRESHTISRHDNGLISPNKNKYLLLSSLQI